MIFSRNLLGPTDESTVWLPSSTSTWTSWVRTVPAATREWLWAQVWKTLQDLELKLQLMSPAVLQKNITKGWLQQNDLRSQKASSILGAAMGCLSFEGLIRGSPVIPYPISLSNTTSASWKCLSRSACPHIHDSNQKLCMHQ